MSEGAITTLQNVMHDDPFTGVGLGDNLINGDELASVNIRSDEAAAALHTLLGQLEQKAEGRRQEFLAEARGHLSGLVQKTEHGNIGPEPDAIKAVMSAAELKAEREARRFAVGLIDLNKQTIEDIKARLHKSAERLATFLRVHPTPVSLLSVQSLSDPRRAVLSQNIENAGPAELLNLAKLAITTNDRALAAAVLARNDRLPSAKRAFSSQQFAERVVGEEHRRYKDAHRKLSGLYQSVYNRVNQLATGKATNPLEKIKSGLKTAGV